MSLAQGKVEGMPPLPLLHHMVCTNAHPHRELAESVQLLRDAGADLDAKILCSEINNERTPLMLAVKSKCCAARAAALL
jgi:hypothetical protein